MIAITSYVETTVVFQHKLVRNRWAVFSLLTMLSNDFMSVTLLYYGVRSFTIIKNYEPEEIIKTGTARLIFENDAVRLFRWDKIPKDQMLENQ